MNHRSLGLQLSTMNFKCQAHCCGTIQADANLIQIKRFFLSSSALRAFIFYKKSHLLIDFNFGNAFFPKSKILDYSYYTYLHFLSEIEICLPADRRSIESKREKFKITSLFNDEHNDDDVNNICLGKRIMTQHSMIISFSRIKTKNRRVQQYNTGCLWSVYKQVLTYKTCKTKAEHAIQKTVNKLHQKTVLTGNPKTDSFAFSFANSKKYRYVPTYSLKYSACAKQLVLTFEAVFSIAYAEIFFMRFERILKMHGKIIHF